MRALRSLPRRLPMLAALALAACIPPDKRYDYPAWGFSMVIVVDTAPDETLDSITKGDAGPPSVVATREGHVGREVRFSQLAQPIFIARYFLVGRRLYELDTSATSSFDDPFVAGFLNSLRITAVAPRATNAPVPASAP